MSFPCNSSCSVKQEIIDTPRLQENEIQSNYKPELTFLTMKKEEVTINESVHYFESELQEVSEQDFNLDENIKKEYSTDNLEETKQIFISSYQNVEQEPNFLQYTENLVKNERDPLAINDMKIEIVKEEYSFTKNVKEKNAVGLQGEQKYEENRYNNDVAYCNLDFSVANNHHSFTSVSEGSIPSINNSEREKTLVLGGKGWNTSLDGEKQNMRNQKFSTDRTLIVLPKRRKNIECNECHELFSYPELVKKHVKNVHNRIKSFKCDECQKMFAYIKHLEIHINAVHRRIKKFVCNECQKSFSQAGTLKRHTDVVHKRIKRFQCKECYKTFAQATNLKQHVKGIHRGIKFECDECLKTFSRLGDLALHINSVHKGKTFGCNECRKSFLYVKNLKSHIKAVHRKIQNSC